MLRRSLISLLIAVALMALLAAAVGAQATPEDAEVAPSIDPIGAAIVQAVPLTLTVNIPGPDGMMTVEVPIVLSLDIQIAVGNVLTTTVVVTPEVAAPVEAVPTQAPPAPTTVPPTPTRVPPTATPTAAAPTPQPVGQTPTAAPEEEATPEAEEESTPEADAEATPEAEEEATPEAEEEATAEPEDEAMIEPEACTDPRSVIFAPAAGDVISGTVEVTGTANHERFSYYKLEYAPVGGETDGVYAFIMDAQEKVIDGLLAELDTTELDNGAYVLKLTVVDNTGNFPPPCAVPVAVEN